MILGEIYRCHVQNNLNIVSLGLPIITSATGQHTWGKTNSDLIGIMIYGKSTEYFPRGLEKVFTNLKSIDVCYGYLKEITQADLKLYKKLVNLDLDHNNIQVLEEGLFDYNPNLKLIWIGNIKISHINSNLFNNLYSLTSLKLYSNVCINMNAFENRDGVQSIIKNSQNNCQNQNYLGIMKKFENLEYGTSNFITNEFSDFNERLENLASDLNISKFFNFESMKRRFENLGTH